MCEAIKGMLNDAREEGLVKGREEGAIEEKKTMAGKLLREGWAVEKIAAFLDVAIVDVEIWLADQTRN